MNRAPLPEAWSWPCRTRQGRARQGRTRQSQAGRLGLALGLALVHVLPNELSAEPSRLPHRNYSDANQAPKNAPLNAGHSPWGRESAAEWVRRAKRSEARGDRIRAVTHYNAALNVDPSFGAAYLGLGLLRRKMGDLTEAERTLSSAIRLPEIAAQALEARAELRWDMGRYRDATMDLAQAVARQPRNQDRLEKLAGWYIRGRAFSAALAALRRLSSERPEDRSLQIRILALTQLANITDPASHFEPDDDWVRRSIARLAQPAR